MDISETREDVLVQRGAPLSVAQDIVQEVATGRRFIDWPDFLTRLFYARHAVEADFSGRAYPVVPQDHRLLQELGFVISTDQTGQTGQRLGLWWHSPLQKLSSPGNPSDDTFPAEFRAPFVRRLRSRQTELLGRDQELHFSYLFAQIQYLDANTYQYLGYTLSRAQKERLVARWAADYPELSENALATWDVAWDVPPGGSPGQVPHYELQCRKFRGECWSALLRHGAYESHLHTGEGEALCAPPLPDWLGAHTQGYVAGQDIPGELRPYYRVDPYGNVVAVQAEPYSICAWDVDHVFPRRRGGKSVLQNFAATHWYAKRYIKGEKLLSTIVISKDGRNPLRCGLSEAGLAALWHGRTLLPDALHTSAAFVQFLHTLLCTNWRRADHRELYNTRLGLLHTTPTDQLFSVLLQEFQASVTSLVASWHVGLLATAATAGADTDTHHTPDPTPHPPTDTDTGTLSLSDTQSGTVSSLTASGQQGGVGIREGVTVHGVVSTSGRDQVVGSGGPGGPGQQRRRRMGSAAVDPHLARRVYNEVVTLGQGADIPSLAVLPTLPDTPTHTSPRVSIDASRKDVSTRRKTDSWAAAAAATDVTHTGSGADQLRETAGGDRQHQHTANPHTDLPSAGSLAATDGVAATQSQLDRIATHYSQYSEGATGEVRLVSEDTFYALKAPKPVKRVRPRMTSSTTQTALDNTDASTATAAAAAAAAASGLADTAAGADEATLAAVKPKGGSSKTRRGNKGTDVATQNVPVVSHAYAHQGIVTWNTLPLPPAMPPSRLTTDEALATTRPVTAPAPAPAVTYTPPFDPVIGTWRLRPRNPLADPYIAESYDFGPGGAAQEGSSLTAQGIVARAVHAAEGAAHAEQPAVGGLITAAWEEPEDTDGTIRQSIRQGATEGRAAHGQPMQQGGQPVQGQHGAFWSPQMAYHEVTLRGSQRKAGGYDGPPAYSGAPPYQRPPPTLEVQPIPVSTHELNELRLQRWGRKAAADVPPHTAMLPLPRRDKEALDPTRAAVVLSPGPAVPADRQQAAAPQVLLSGPHADRVTMPQQPVSEPHAAHVSHAGVGFGTATQLAYQSVEYGQGLLDQRRYAQQEEAAHKLAQDGVLTNLPLWVGGPEPISNPHMGPGQPHPALLRLLAVHRSQPPVATPVLGLPPLLMAPEALSQPQLAGAQPGGSAGKAQAGGLLRLPEQLPWPLGPYVPPPAKPAEPPPLEWPQGPRPPWLPPPPAAYQQPAGTPAPAGSHTPPQPHAAGLQPAGMQGPDMPAQPQVFFPYHYHVPLQLQPMDTTASMAPAQQPATAAAADAEQHSRAQPAQQTHVWATPQAAAALAAAQVPAPSVLPPALPAAPATAAAEPAAADADIPPRFVPLMPLSPRTISQSFEQWSELQDAAGLSQQDAAAADVVRYEPQWEAPAEQASAANLAASAAKAAGHDSDHETPRQSQSQADSVPLSSLHSTAQESTTHTAKTVWSPIQNIDLPPPAFDRHRSRPNSASGGAAADRPAAASAADAAGSKTLTQRVLSGVKKLARKVSMRGKDRDKKTQDGAGQPAVMPIGILPTTLETLEEEDLEGEAEANTPPRQDSSLPDDADQRTPTADSAAAAATAESPAHRALSAALHGVRGLFGRGGEMQTVPVDKGTTQQSTGPHQQQGTNSLLSGTRPQTTGYYPALPSGSPIAKGPHAGSSSAGQGWTAAGPHDSVQHAAPASPGARQQGRLGVAHHDSPTHSSNSVLNHSGTNPLNQTLRGRSQAASSIRSSLNSTAERPVPVRGPATPASAHTGNVSSAVQGSVLPAANSTQEDLVQQGVADNVSVLSPEWIAGARVLPSKDKGSSSSGSPQTLRAGRGRM